MTYSPTTIISEQKRVNVTVCRILFSTVYSHSCEYSVSYHQLRGSFTINISHCSSSNYESASLLSTDNTSGLWPP